MVATKQNNKKYRIYGVVSERTKLPAVWIGTLIMGDKKDGIFHLKGILGETKEVHSSECKIDYLI